MNKLSVATVIVVFGLASLANASETTISRACDGSGNNCTTTISRPPLIPEPIIRGPVSSEEVFFIVKNPNVEPTPKQRNDNFCGTGFKMTNSGCEPLR